MKVLNYENLIAVIDGMKIDLAHRQTYSFGGSIQEMAERINLLVAIANCFEEVKEEQSAPKTLFGAKVVLSDQVPEGEIWLRKSEGEEEEKLGTFFEEPISKMSRDQLLELVGWMSGEMHRLTKIAKEAGRL